MQILYVPPLSPEFLDKRPAVHFWHLLLKSLWQNKELTRRLCSSQCEGVLYLTIDPPEQTERLFHNYANKQKNTILKAIAVSAGARNS